MSLSTSVSSLLSFIDVPLSKEFGSIVGASTEFDKINEGWF